MTDCLAPRHDAQDEPAEAEAHSHLCRPCRLGLLHDLRRLPGLHADLAYLPPTGEGDGDGPPFNEHAADCRSQIRHDLKFWAAEAGEVIKVAPPTFPDLWWASSTPAYALAGWLAGHMKWIPFRDWAPLMAGTMAENRKRAFALLNPYAKRQFPIPGADGLCIACDTGQPCACPDCGEKFTGTDAFDAHFTTDGKGRQWCELPPVMKLACSPAGLWTGRAQVTVYEPHDRRWSSIWCPVCGGRWDSEQWMSYGRRVLQRREAMAS